MSTCTVCMEKGCCHNCFNYEGGIELIPTREIVTCIARKGETVVLPYNGYPEIDGDVDKDCLFWVRRDI